MISLRSAAAKLGTSHTQVKRVAEKLNIDTSKGVSESDFARIQAEFKPQAESTLEIVYLEPENRHTDRLTALRDKLNDMKAARKPVVSVQELDETIEMLNLQGELLKEQELIQNEQLRVEREKAEEAYWAGVRTAAIARARKVQAIRRQAMEEVLSEETEDFFGGL